MVVFLFYDKILARCFRMKKLLLGLCLLLLVFSISISQKVIADETIDELFYVLNDSSLIEASKVEMTLNANQTLENGEMNINFTLKNPTNQKEVLSLAVPYQENCELMLNGQAITPIKRHSLTNDLEFAEDYYHNTLYYKDALVKKITYKVSSPEFANYSSLAISTLFEFDEDKTHFMTSTAGINHEFFNDHMITNWVSSDENFDLYIIGEDISDIEWKIYKNSRLLQEVEGSVEIVSTTDVTLGEVLLADCPSDINEMDWFNNKVKKLINDVNYATSFEELSLAKDFASYWVYELAIESLQSVEHSMKLSLESSVDDTYSPNVYEFNFSLKSFEKFANIEEFILNINTNYYLVEPTLDFTKNDYHYQTTVDNLNNYLVLRLSSSANPEPNIDMLELSIKIVISSISLLCLLALIFMPKRIRRSYRLSDYKLPQKIENKYRGQNYLAIIAIILSLIGMHYKILFSAIALGFVLLAFIISLVGHFKYRLANSLGIIALALAIASSANLFYQSKDIFEINTVIVTICLLVYGINNIALYNNVESNKEEEHYYLPMDFLSKKSFIWYMLFILFIMFVGMIILVFEFKISYVIIISAINLLLVIIYRVIKVVFFDYHPIHKYYRDLDYVGLKIRMENSLSEDGIHPKTYNGYLIRLAEIAMANDFDDYIKYISTFKPVLKKSEQIDYDCLKLNYLLSRKEFNALNQDLRIKYHDYANLLNKLHKRYEYWLPYYSGEVAESIVLQYPYHYKNKWKNARNLFIQINHYVSRGNYGKARELGKLFKKKYGSLKLFMEKINGLNLNRL